LPLPDWLLQWQMLQKLPASHSHSDSDLAMGGSQHGNVPLLFLAQTAKQQLHQKALVLLPSTTELKLKIGQWQNINGFNYMQVQPYWE
jgi:hypothetical protein